MKKAISVFGLGFGDEGKGSIVDLLSKKMEATVVIKANGGCETNHNVTHKGHNGVVKHFPFSQMGAGSFDMAETHISSYFLFEPISFAKEYDAFNRIMGHGGPQLLVTVDPRALVTTRFHGAANRELERSRGSARHGSAGRGIGQTMAYATDFPEYAIRYDDLLHRDVLIEKLQHMAAYYDNSTIDVVELADLMRESCLDKTKMFKDEDIISEHESMIFEHSHGILLDQDYGFAPHNTWSKTTTENTYEMLSTFPDVELRTIGCLRSYMTRHGHGPMPTYSPTNEKFNRLDEPHKITTEWAGPFRKGFYDEVLLRYAIQVQGHVDFLALNHVDVFTHNLFRIDDSQFADEIWEAEPEARVDIVKNQPVTITTGEPWSYSFVEDSLGLPVGIVGGGEKSDNKHIIKDDVVPDMTLEEMRAF